MHDNYNFQIIISSFFRFCVLRVYITLNVAFKAPVGKTSGHAGPSAERAEKHNGMSVLYKVWRSLHLNGRRPYF